ncbi:Uncharacterised protein [Shigella sonnei]|nr:Uncharacterised protein [Shigella sonnei]
MPRASCHKCGLLMGTPETAYGAPDNKFRVYMVFLTGEIISPTTIRLWHCSLKLIASDLAHTPVKIPHHANGT